MPSGPRRCNRGLHALCLLSLLLSAGACTRTLDLRIELDSSSEPDPFRDVQTVGLIAILDGRTVAVGSDRWDQGPIPFDLTLDPGLEGFVVIGLDADGGLVSSGASGPLDLLSAPPDGPVRILFSRVGVLSRLEASAAPHDGLEGIGLDDGRVLFLGGRGADGCLLAPTEIFDLSGASPGPLLANGRTGDFDVAPLAGGQVLVAGGEVDGDCGAPQPAMDVVVLDPHANTAQSIAVPAPLRDGAGIAVVDASLVVVAGGEGDPAFSPEVLAIDPRAGTTRVLGSLDGPRAHAAAVRIGGGRIALIGGRSNPAEGVLGDATVFVPRRGAALSERLPLGAGIEGPSALRTMAGAVVITGGADEQGAGTAVVRALVVSGESAASLGDTSVVTSLTATVSSARAISTGDGGLLVLPKSAAPPSWVRLLPRGSDALEVPGGAVGPWVGGLRSDGQVLLRNRAGTMLVFNPGPSALLGPAATEGRLAAGPDGPSPRALGLIPLRPGAWRQTTFGVEGQASGERRQGREPSEWAVLGTGPVQDFSLELLVRLGPDAQASLLFGLVDDEHDHVNLVGNASVGRSAARSATRPVSCASVPTPGLLASGAHRLRLRRVADRVMLDVDADGVDDLVCELLGSPVGHVAVGIVNGSVTFDEIRFVALPNGTL